VNALEEYTAVTFRAEVWTAKMWLQYADRLQGGLSRPMMPQIELPRLPFLWIFADDAEGTF
jgi:hypothetical protein